MKNKIKETFNTFIGKASMMEKKAREKVVNGFNKIKNKLQSKKQSKEI